MTSTGLLSVSYDTKWNDFKLDATAKHKNKLKYIGIPTYLSLNTHAAGPGVKAYYKNI